MSVLAEQIGRLSAQFHASVSALYVTRSTGQEIVSIEERKIKITNLESGAHYLDNVLEFSPTGLCLSPNDDFLCLYDSTHCSVVSLNEPGSKVGHAIGYSVRINLQHKETIVQIIFNRISQFGAELVILTTDAIYNVDLNSSLTKPTHTYWLRTGSPLASTDSVDVIDPVSLAFGSNTDTMNPRGDLTLLILSSDSSIYKIYPYLPANIAVSSSWLGALFDYASLKYNASGAQDLSTVSMLKFASLLSQSNGHVRAINKVLPSSLSRGKLVGPLNIQPFPDELYEQDALKLISMENDMFCVLYNKALTVLFDDQDQPMVFDGHRAADSVGVVRMVDCLLFGSKTITSGMILPNRPTSLLLTSSEADLLHVDFANWWDILADSIASNDLSGLSNLLKKQLPTKVSGLGKVKLPTTASISDPASFQYTVPHTTAEHMIAYAWNYTHSYAFLGSSVFEVCAPTQPSAPVDTELAPQDVYEKYETLDLNPQLTATKTTLAKVQKELYAMNSNQPLATDTRSLKSLYKVREVITTGLIALFNDVALLNRKLQQMRSQFLVQIATLNEAELNRQDRHKRYESSKRKLEALAGKQAELQKRVSQFAATMEKLEMLTSNHANETLSRKEQAYKRQLERLQKLIAEKQNDFQAVQEYVESLKDMEVVSASQPSGYSREVARMKAKLELRTSLIESLTQELKSTSI
ncbi:hypothetical protein KL906_004448 [Ogataea polymorpha]|nr:hypothetical protein KL906_004448 [Ogataea polymorpha]KAG7930826.1 hypothetical protein KL934_004451 [Ogataea polymorpha]